MQRMKEFIAILGLAVCVSSQATMSASPPLGSVVSIFLLDTDPQPLVASYIGMSGSLTTLAINCPPGTADEDCGYPEPFTVTADASTVTAAAVHEGVSLNYGCTLTGTTSGSCSVTYIGAASVLATDEKLASSATGITTISTGGPISAADITFFPVTVTGAAAAGASSGANANLNASGGTHVQASSSSAAALSSSSTTSGSTGGEYDEDIADTTSVVGSVATKTQAVTVNSVPISTSPNNASWTGKYPSDLNSITIPTYSASAHKIGAPGILGAALLGLAALL